MTLAIHADQIRQHGGASGVRDEGLVESALARPVHRWHYDPAVDLLGLAAAHGVGIGKGHPFVDGNKRAAFQVMYVFLGLNGLRIVEEEPEVVHCMQALAGCEMDEGALRGWLSDRTKRR